MSSSFLKVVPSERPCTKCKVTKPFSEFYRHNKPDSYGHTSRCKECVKEDSRSRLGKHKLDPKLARARRNRAYNKTKEDPIKRQKYLDMKNKWNRSEKYYDGYYQKRFGISLKEVCGLHSRQNGLCANLGCSKKIYLMKEDNGKTTAVVDHSHSTGKVRALLCIRCNATLGHIENNSELIPGLLDYLNKH